LALLDLHSQMDAISMIYDLTFQIRDRDITRLSSTMSPNTARRFPLSPKIVNTPVDGI
jgi:hypothetical protein